MSQPWWVWHSSHHRYMHGLCRIDVQYYCLFITEIWVGSAFDFFQVWALLDTPMHLWCPMMVSVIYMSSLDCWICHGLYSDFLLQFVFRVNWFHFLDVHLIFLSELERNNMNSCVNAEAVKLSTLEIGKIYIYIEVQSLRRDVMLSDLWPVQYLINYSWAPKILKTCV
jgi:hypothetical protein